MTVFYGYLDRPYLQDQYLDGVAEEATGWQCTAVITAAKNTGWQARANIVDHASPRGMQATALIDTGIEPRGFQAQRVIDATAPHGWQSQRIIDTTSAYGWQAQGVIAATTARGWQALAAIDATRALGWQANAAIVVESDYGWQAQGIVGDTPARGWSVKQDTLAHAMVEFPHGYLDDPYLTVPYLGPWMQAMQGWQARAVIDRLAPRGWQAQGVIAREKDIGWQSRNVIDATAPRGWQSQRVILKQTPGGWQAKGVIEKQAARGWQSKGVIEARTARGWQFRSVHAQGIGTQCTFVLYNTTRLRILKEFPSRGFNIASAVDMNAWGYLIGTGKNWVASTTAPSTTNSFTVFNVNTDIVEQRWQGVTGVVTGVTLDCDTERVQGVFLDTMGILDTNLTSSAVVQLLGSNTSDFSVIEQVISLPVDGTGNIYYVAPDLPNMGWRYWRLAIDDFTNPDGYLRIGTIVFGAAIILVQNFVDKVSIDPINYTDEVFTEAFTNVQNDRGIKRLIRLDFKNLKYEVGDYQRLSTVFADARTVLKCLWLPTPAFPRRYAVFGKLRRLPSETHNVKSESTDLVTLTCEVDESK